MRWPRRALTAVLSIGLWTVAAREIFAQAGPPMITDDPGTPGNGHWENNFAISFARSSQEVSFDAPGIDLNYGLGDHIQLTLQTGGAILQRDDHGPVAGMGGTEAALKWRFLDEEKSGVAMSIFPRIFFNVVPSSVHRGLAEDGTRFQLPVEMAKKLGPIGLDIEAGTLVSSVGRSQWLYGLVAGVEITKTTEFMAELHGTSRTNFTQDVLTINVGVRHKLNESCIWIASLGHDLRQPGNEPLTLIGYCGVQLLY
jgi:hypothetical protein